MSARVRVAAGILRRDGRILACRRPPHASHAGKWEFPGGKLEPGESFEECLRRELVEELGIEAEIGEHLGKGVVRYPGKAAIELGFFAVDRFTGEPDDRYYGETRWVLPAELVALDFLEGDLEIVARLARDCRIPAKPLREPR